MRRQLGEQDPSLVHSFEHHKTHILNTIRKLLLKETVSQDEWQNLFHEVHLVCSWDPSGPEKLLKYIRRQLDDTYITHLKCRLHAIEDSCQLFAEYVFYWKDFRQHCDRLPRALQQLDLATRDALQKGLFQSKTNPTVIKITSHMIYPKSSNSRRDATPSALPIATAVDISKRNLTRYGSPYSTVRCLMLKLWADEIINPLIARLLDEFKNLIINERIGNIVDSTLILNLRESFSYMEELRIIGYHQGYLSVLEQIYVESINLFYSTVGAPDKHLRENDVLSYIDWALNKFDGEVMRAIQYMEANSPAIEQVSEVCKAHLISNHVEQLYPASVHVIRTDDIATIQKVYKFFAKISGVVQRLIDEDFRYHIISTGKACLRGTDTFSSSNSDSFVDKLLSLYKKFDEIVSKGFEEDARARQALEQAMSFVINDPKIFDCSFNIVDQTLENSTPMKPPQKVEPESRCAEILANYCNFLFRKSALSRKMSNGDLNFRLTELCLIIKLLKNKDAFIKIHKYHLVRRLILDASISIDKEEDFIIQIKDTFGMPLEEINELLRMFKDLKASDVLNTQFIKSMKPNLIVESVNNNNTISNITSQITDRLSIQENNNRSSPVNIKVLNPSAWTKNIERCAFKLPKEVASSTISFQVFYKNQYEGREIEWCHQLSNGVITFRNRDGNKYDLEVTAAQYSILSSFDTNPLAILTLDELRLASSLNSSDLRRTLGSLLINPKLKSQIMNCEPKIESIKDLDRTINLYSINHGFTLVKNGKPQTKGRICLIGRLQI